jgi:hypothetical protein
MNWKLYKQIALAHRTKLKLDGSSNAAPRFINTFTARDKELTH